MLHMAKTRQIGPALLTLTPQKREGTVTTICSAAAARSAALAAFAGSPDRRGRTQTAWTMFFGIDRRRSAASAAVIGDSSGASAVSLTALPSARSCANTCASKQGQMA